MVARCSPCGVNLNTTPQSISVLYIFIDSNDIVYVTDGTKRHVLIFTTEGDFLGIFGCAGVPNFNPNGVAVDNTGKLYVCDSEMLVSRLL